ncbi:hypothetical protein CDCA_CDCA12G3451 [Cyanidium caldarium]|uniref:shikimate kinase n=1 Tax=Cyanidium caldarium TaxID=2771 RepID=A0AAV9IZ73_CYACA|nr:hypothetical protein CDCA_CDCA12G3451 [Cyanidium caldarium]
MTGFVTPLWHVPQHGHYGSSRSERSQWQSVIGGACTPPFRPPLSASPGARFRALCARRRASARSPLQCLQGSEGASNGKPDEQQVYREFRDRLQGLSVYLVGMMGAGKTSIGWHLAQQMRYAFYDTDTIIEGAAGKSIPRIFSEDGEQAFRDLETRTLNELQAYVRAVIATGGGCVLRPQNWGSLHTGLVVYLRASPRLLAERVGSGHGRPLLMHRDDAGPPAEDIDADVRHKRTVLRLQELLEQREKFYEQADVIVDVEPGMSMGVVALTVARQSAQRIRDNPPTPARRKFFPSGENP